VVAAVAFAAVHHRLERITGPIAFSAVIFAAGVAALAWAGPRVALAPMTAGVVLAYVTALDLGINNGPSSSSALPPSTYDVLQPGTANALIRELKARVVDDSRRRDRVELAGLGFHWPNASMTHRLENTLGYNPVRLGLYSAATGAEDHVGLPDQRKFSPLMPSYRSKLANLLGLRWIATSVPIEDMDHSLRAGDLPLVSRPDGNFLYENTGALPRVLFATKARAAVFDEMVRTGIWPDFDPTTTVLLGLPKSSGDARRPGQAHILAYHQNKVVITTECPDGGYVVLNDIWHPWWYGELDGRPVPIERANVLFRAIWVPPGRHVVTMEFRPLSGIWKSVRERLARRESQKFAPAN
jgi:hypothetical protein